MSSWSEIMAKCRGCVPSGEYALLRPDGNLAFIDFEYAGWDDPAKTLCDFYCQSRRPPPHESWERFAERTVSFAEDFALERARQTSLHPQYQTKWCCILLNEFATADRQRREFATDASQCEKQLRKAIQFADQCGIG